MEAIQSLGLLLESLASRLQLIEAKLGLAGASTVVSSQPEGTATELAPQIVAYDEYAAQYLPAFLAAAKSLGDGIKVLGDITERAFKAHRAYLVMTSQCKKPASLESEYLKDLQACMDELKVIPDNRSQFYNHQSMINDGIKALGWVCVEWTPKPFIESYVEGSDFFGNKIRVQFKGASREHINFVSSFKALLVGLMAYVKEYHLTGVTWNPRGIDTSDYATSSTPVTSSAATVKAAVAAGVESVFDGIRSIDQSEGRTAGLNKVTKEMQTWRTEYKPSNRSPVPRRALAEKKAVPTATKPAKPPVFEQCNGNWRIENYVGGSPVVVNDLTIKQQVYVYGCTDAVIVLEGKAKTIVLDGCKQTKLIFDSAVSSIEIINCKSVQVQCKDKVPSVAIDKTDGCLVYVSWEGRGVQFVTSKSSEMNVVFPISKHGNEIVEKPIPEQFVHTITMDHAVSSTVSDLYIH